MTVSANLAAGFQQSSKRTLQALEPDVIQTQLRSFRYGQADVVVATTLRRSGNSLIVFLHGLACAKESFAAAFSIDAIRGFSICALDFPGHGSSGRLNYRQYSIQAYADIVNLLIDELAPDRVYLVCHSMGGAVGLVAARDRRDVACFISAEGNLVAEDCGLVSRHIATQSPEAFEREGYQSFLGELQASQSHDCLMWANWCARADPLAIYQSARSLVEWSDAGHLIGMFRKLDFKAYIYGDKEPKRYLTRTLCDVPTRSVPGAGHFMMTDNPADFYATVSGLIDTAQSASPEIRP